MMVCPKCGAEKDESEFGKNAARESGKALYCLICARWSSREHRIRTGKTKPAGWLRKTADKAAYRRAWNAAHPGSANRWKAKWLAKNPQRRKAKYATRDAIKSGRLIRGPCERCGVELAEAHHPDYSKPLEVVWLCRVHHLEEHRRILDSAGARSDGISTVTRVD